MFRTAVQLWLGIGQIIAFNEGVPLLNAVVLCKICECRHKSYRLFQNSLAYVLVADSYGTGLT